MSMRESLEVIYKRNLVLYLSIIIGIFVAVQLVTTYSFIQYMKHENISKTKLIADIISTAVNFQSVDDIREELDHLDYKSSFNSITVFSKEEKIIAHHGNGNNHPANNESALGELLGTTTNFEIISGNEIVGHIHVHFHTGILLEKIAFDLVFSLVLIVTLILITYKGSAAIHTLILSPVVSFTELVKSVAASNNLHQIIDLQKYNDTKELYELSSEFNNMINNLSLGQMEVEESKNELEKTNKNLESIVNKKTETLNETISHLKSYQNKLISQEKLASMGTLAAGIAHEIKNPLNLINNSAGLIETFIREELPVYVQSIHDGTFEKNSLYFEEDVAGISNACLMIVKNGNRADSIIKNLLAQSRGDTPDFEKVDLKSLVDEFFKLSFHAMRANRAMDVVKILDICDVGRLHLIPQDIGRALTNLFDNAYYSMSEKLTEYGEDYHPEITVSLSIQEDKFALISIKDNGEGMDKATCDKVFEPFFTTKPAGKGTGLGLSMVYDIVRSHQGTLSVKTEPGIYTEFTILLPLHIKGLDND